MGYNYETTFWQDFDFAEPFGEDSIRDTARRCFEEWKDNILFLTELVMIINHKCWAHYHRGNDALSDIYADLYYEYNDKALDYLKEKGNKDDIHYYIRTLD